MCGIAGLIWKGGATSDIGSEMTQMLQALKHRGPDSTGLHSMAKAMKACMCCALKLLSRKKWQLDSIFIARL